VVLLQVVNAPFELALLGSPAMSVKAVEGDIARAKSYLGTVARSDELAGVEKTIMAALGETVQQILSVVSTQDVDLVIIASRGRTGLARWALGSVAYVLVHRSPVPLLVLREGHLGAALAEVSATRPISAVVALDGSPFAETVLQPAAHLVSMLTAPHRGVLHLAQVVRPSSARKQEGDVSQHTEEARERANAYLTALQGQLLQMLEEPKPLITRSVLFDEDIASALITLAEQGERGDGEGFGSSDLIALSTHGRGGVRGLLLGSIANRVLNTTRLPLFILRPRQLETGLQ
jgi:nucleotide-binding universal stress UspA family protein